MQHITKYSAALTTMAFCMVLGTGCLKDQLADDGLTIPDIGSSPKLIELPGPIRATSSYNTSYAVSLMLSNNDTTFNVVPVRLASNQPATEDIQVQLELDPSLLTAYNDSTGSHLVQPAAADFELSNNLVVTIPKGSREGYLQMTTTPASLAVGEFGLGIRIKSVSNSGYIISGNFNNAVVIVGVRNNYDGIYEMRGYALRAGDPSLTGNFTGVERGLVTTGPNSVIFDDLAVWGDGSSGIGIGEPELLVNPVTNKVTISSAGGATNAPAYDSRYDPATRTFFISFTWGAGPAARLSTDTLVYIGPRP
jgi:hypothetical protein